MTSERKQELILYVKEVTKDWLKNNRVFGQARDVILDDMEEVICMIEREKQ